MQQRARFGISFGASRCVWDQNEHGQRGGSSVAAVNGSSSVVAASSSAVQRPWRGVAAAAVWSRVARPQQASASLGHCVRVALAVRCGQSVGRACVWACGSARAGLSAVAVRPAAAVCNCRNVTMFYLPVEFLVRAGSTASSTQLDRVSEPPRARSVIVTAITLTEVPKMRAHGRALATRQLRRIPVDAPLRR